MNIELAVNELLNPSLDLGARIDLAMALGFEEDLSINAALLTVASDSNNPEPLLDACGESLGEIWAKSGQMPLSEVTLLTPEAKAIAIATYNARRPNP